MPTLDARYTINGLIDTSQPALDNMTAVVNSCNTWLSYDALEGKWAVVINQAGNSAVSFDDSNIVGAVNLSTTDLGSLYNSVEVRFHNLTLRDREDYVLLEIPDVQRLANEPDKRLIINAPMVNNQIQAQLLGLIELKQSRLDKVIKFTTDFSYINIEAGTIISVTNSVYGWTNKLFRVLQLAERDDDTTIVIDITAQEYDADIYDDTDLYLYLRETQDGLIELDPLTDVSAITDSSAVVDSSGNSLLGLLGANALIALLKRLIEDKSSATGGIFDSILDVYKNVTGQSLTSVGGVLGFEKELTIGISTGNTASPWRGGNSSYTTTNSLAFTMPAAGNIAVDMYANFGDSVSSTGTGLRKIDFAVFTGNTHGAGNLVVNVNGDPTNPWERATSYSGQDIFGDLFVRQVGNIAAGTYHIESSYWSNIGDTAQINIVISNQNNVYTS